MARPPSCHCHDTPLDLADIPGRGVLERLDVPMIATRLDGEVVWANAACVTVSGIPLDQLVGDRPPYRWTSGDPEKLRELLASMRVCGEGDEPVKLFEFSFVMATGHRQRCEVIRELLYDCAGRAAGFLCAARPLRRDAVVAFGRHFRSLHREQLLEQLSPRERETVALMLDGFRVPAIARRLFVSPHTVRNHLKGAYRKLGVSSQSELIERLRSEEPTQQGE